MGKLAASVGTEPTSLFASALHHAHALFTPKHVGYTLAGAFVMAGTAAVTSSDADSTAATGNVKGYSTQTSIGNATANNAPASSVTPTDDTSSTSTAFSANSTNGGAPDVRLSVNGQDIPVPTNGSSQRTVTSSDGSQMSVSASGNVNSQGDATNKSTTSFSLNVTNVSTGSTTP